MDNSINDVLKTDVLVIGGGVSGCFASIRASELGVDVTLIEKSALRRCSCTGPGMDHFPFVKELGAEPVPRKSPPKGIANPYAWIVSKDAYRRMLDLESFGVKMKQDDGTFKVVLPEIGEVAFFGPDMQKRLAEAVRKRGVNVMERVIVVDLLSDGKRVSGMVGFNTRTGEIIVISSKTTVMAAGNFARAYTGYNGELFDTRSCATNDGSAPALAYRAGAEVTGMEFSLVRPDLKNEKLMSLGMFTRYPEGLRGRVVNVNGDVLENKTEKSEVISWRGRNLVEQILLEEREGRGPCYWDLSHLPESQIEVFYWHVRSEAAIREEFQKDRGVWGLRGSKFLFEIKVKPSDILGGVLTNEDMATSIEGLYACGNAACSGSIPGASVTGHVAGENAAREALKSGDELELDSSLVSSITNCIRVFNGIKGGLNPVTFERKVRKVLDEYAGIYKSEGMLKRGLEILEQVGKKFMPLIHARNSHEVMRALEAKNIWLSAKMHLKASMLRNESRPYFMSSMGHCRIEYPEKEGGLDKPIVIKMVDGEMDLCWREAYVPSITS